MLQMTDAPAGTEDELLGLVRTWSAQAGVTRCTSITQIDRVGVPVAIAVRPTAASGSLVVTGGKGWSERDAEIGARMEAVELAYAEPGTGAVEPLAVTFRDVAATLGGPADLLRLCPLTGLRIPLDEQLLAVPGQALSDDREVLLPSELVFVPPPRGAATRPYFGSSSIGLGCGLTLERATQHALLEAAERDTLSFPVSTSQEFPIAVKEVGGEVTECVTRIAAAGVNIFGTVVLGELGLPVAHVVLVDDFESDTRFINGGHACDPRVERAVERALLEAVQSRVSFMHGGREDLPALAGPEYRPPVPRAAAVPLSTVTAACSAQSRLQTVEELVGWIESCGVGPAIRVILRDGADAGPWVVRVIVPGCESYLGPQLHRVGPRLRERLHV